MKYFRFDIAYILAHLPHSDMHFGGKNQATSSDSERYTQNTT